MIVTIIIITIITITKKGEMSVGKIVLAAKIAHVPSILISEREGPL